MLSSGPESLRRGPAFRRLHRETRADGLAGKIVLLLHLGHGRQGIGHGFDAGGGKSGQVRKPGANDVDGALRLGQSQAQARSREMRLVLHQRIIHSLFDAFANQSLGLERGRVLFLQVRYQCFPLGQLGVTQDRVLDHLVPLVFGLNRSRVPIRFGGADKIAGCGIENRGLRIHVENRRRRALQTKREAPRLAQSGADHELRNILVPRLAVGSKDALLVGAGSGRRRAVRQCQFDRALERQGLGGEPGATAKQTETNSKTLRRSTRRVSRTHIFTFEDIRFVGKGRL